MALFDFGEKRCKLLCFGDHAAGAVDLEHDDLTRAVLVHFFDEFSNLVGAELQGLYEAARIPGPRGLRLELKQALADETAALVVQELSLTGREFPCPEAIRLQRGAHARLARLIAKTHAEPAPW